MLLSRRNRRAAPRCFYATGAPADFVSDYRNWREHVDNPTEVSVTFSSQVLDFAAARTSACMLVSGHPDGQRLDDGAVQVVHAPKPDVEGPSWYLFELLHGLKLFWRARQFGADIAVLDSGTMPYWLMLLFRLAGAHLVVVMHNALYPAGMALRGRAKLRLQLQRWALGHADVLGVSPECVRQAATGAVFHPLFRRSYFDQIAPVPPQGPFNVLYVGRIVESKGALDIPAIARLVERQRPGAVRWTVVGDGEDLQRLRREAEGLPIDLLGRLGPVEQVPVRSACHAVIVPTRRELAEGFSMAAVEGVLSGRPVITNATVPALEVIRPACVEVEANDLQAYATAVLALAADHDRWQRLVAECEALKEAFFEEEHALARSLARLLPQPTHCDRDRCGAERAAPEDQGSSVDPLITGSP